MAYPANAIVEVKIGYVVNGQQCYNVLHYKPDGVGAGSPLEMQAALVDSIDGQFAVAGTLLNTMRLLQSEPDCNYNTISAQCIYPTRFRAFIADYNVDGLVVAPCNAQNVAAVVQKFGEGGDRHNIGSFHLGGLATSVYENGELTAGAKLNLDTVAAQLKTIIGTVGFGDLTYTPHILNKIPVVIDGKKKFIISGATPLFGTDAKETLRVMRRRTVRVGI